MTRSSFQCEKFNQTNHILKPTSRTGSTKFSRKTRIRHSLPYQSNLGLWFYGLDVNQLRPWLVRDETMQFVGFVIKSLEEMLRYQHFPDENLILPSSIHFYIGG